MDTRLCESVRRTQTEHVQYCGRAQGHYGPCGFADGNGMHFWLDAYEVANLREMLTAIEQTPLLSGVFANGDWFQQVKQKLTRGFVLPHNLPNATASQLMSRFEQRAAGIR